MYLRDVETRPEIMLDGCCICMFYMFLEKGMAWLLGVKEKLKRRDFLLRVY